MKVDSLNSPTREKRGNDIHGSVHELTAVLKTGKISFE